jgi:hypothetical protein
MKKFVDISLLLDQVLVEGQPLVRIHVAHATLRDFCLCLQLLHDGLTEAFAFRRKGSSKRAQVVLGEGSRSVVKDRADTLDLAMSASDLDFARHFFLRYYRDGATEVDHIDIETQDGGYITFSVDRFLPAVSSEEAKRRLGI